MATPMFRAGNPPYQQDYENHPPGLLTIDSGII